MSVVEISHAVVRRAELALNRIDGGLWPGTLVAATLAAIPPITRLLQVLNIVFMTYFSTIILIFIKFSAYCKKIKINVYLILTLWVIDF